MAFAEIMPLEPFPNLVGNACWVVQTAHVSFDKLWWFTRLRSQLIGARQVHQDTTSSK